MTAFDLHSMQRSGRGAVASVLLCMSLTAAAAVSIAAAGEAPFLKENDVAMERMMEGMSIKPTGDVDQDVRAGVSS